MRLARFVRFAQSVTNVIVGFKRLLGCAPPKRRTYFFLPRPNGWRRPPIARASRCGGDRWRRQPCADPGKCRGSRPRLSQLADTRQIFSKSLTPFRGGRQPAGPNHSFWFVANLTLASPASALGEADLAGFVRFAQSVTKAIVRCKVLLCSALQNLI